jgi:tetratricopeptide (TPR) repeat protein
MISFTKKIFFFFLFAGALVNLRAQDSASIADSLKETGDYNAAIKIYSRLLDTDIESKNKKNLCKDYNNMGNIYFRLGDYDKSMTYYFNALKIANETGDKKQQAATNYNIGMTYTFMKQDSNAVDFVNKAIELFLEVKDYQSLAECYNVLASFYEEKEYKTAFYYYNKAESIFTTLNQKGNVANVYVNISYMLLNYDSLVLAEEYARKGLVIFKQVNDYLGIATSYVNLQMIHYFQHKNADGPNNKKEIQYCIALLDSGLLAIKNINSPEHLIHIYQNKSELYKDMGNTDSAYFYLQKYDVVKDSIYDVTKQKQIQELRIQYESNKKEQQNTLLQKENELLVAKNESRNFLIIIIIIGGALLVSVLLLVLLRNNSRKKQKVMEFEKSKLEYEQKALRAQMNPHFIFNALNSIQHYILSNETQYAYDYLAKFSKLIRQVLVNSEHNTISLKKELELMRLYVDLEQRRFKNRFEYEIKCDDDLLLDDIVIPVMLIQPFVENAIWHGIMNLDETKKGKLLISLDLQDNVLIISVEDNGVGRKKSAQLKTNNEHESVGMLFSQKRLEILKSLNDMDTRVTMTDLYDENGIASGTRVELFLSIKI